MLVCPDQQAAAECEWLAVHWRTMMINAASAVEVQAQIAGAAT